MRRVRCGGCGSVDWQPFLDLGATPLADTYPASPDEVERTWPLQVALCNLCSLVQLTEIVPDNLLYGADYGFHTGSSPSAVGYFRDYAAWAAAQFPDLGFVAEVACNDGTLLEGFAQQGRRTLGIEPAAGPAEAAYDRGLRVIPEPFGLALAQRVVAENGRADLVLANNVTAHVADLDDFVAGISVLTGGAAVIEVQYVGDLVAGNQFDHIYHEHRYYFSVTTLERVLNRHGLHIRQVMHTPAQGGSVRVVADHDEHTGVGRPDERWLSYPATYLSMQGRVERIRTRLLDLLAEEVHAGRKVAGYGATAKSATLLNYCGIGPDLVDRIVDLTPGKVGRYTPGTKIPIDFPGAGRADPDTFLLLAWNYLSGVLQREASFHRSGGRFLVPIPYPVIL